MKILISNATMGHGGAERVISIVTKELVKKGHEVEVLLYYDKPIFYALDENVKVTIDEKVIGKANVIKHCLFRRKYIKTEKPDVVISFLAPFNMLMLVTMLGIRIPLVLADRNDPRKVPGNFVVRKVRDFLYRFADAVVVQNESNKAYFSKQVQKKCQVIYNPIDMGEYAGSALREKKAKKIVSVGRLVKQKNPQLLLNLHIEFYPTNF